LGESEFAVIDIDGDDGGAMEGGGGDGAEADSATAENEDFIRRRDAAAAGGVVTDGERFDEAEVAELEAVGDDQFFEGYGDVFGEGAVALDAQGLVIAAGVGPLAKAGGADAATGVGRKGDGLAGPELFGHIGADRFDGSGDFMAGDAGIGDEGIFSAEAAEIGTAHAYEAHSEQGETGALGWRIQFADFGFERFPDIECAHKSTPANSRRVPSKPSKKKILGRRCPWPGLRRR